MHASLTCKNHPQLRWSCKRIAISPTGGYNGARNIFFCGRVTDPVKLYSDRSGVDCEEYVTIDGKFQPVRECDCSASELILAPEDAQLAQ